MTAALQTDPRAATSARLPHLPALDGLRGVAVAGVLLFHAGHLAGGYLGVDLFFVLSGFLITSLLLREATAASRIDLAAFWSRRARRLLPALAGLLVLVAGYARFLADPSELARIRADGLATVLYVANWRSVVAERDYWELFSAPSPLQHMWSVAIEEQFYVLWPLLVLALLRWRGAHRLARTVLVASCGLAGASLALMVALHEPGDRTRAYFGTDTRAASILLGAALAAWIALRGPARAPGARAAVQAVGLAAAAVLAVAWLRVDGGTEGLYRGGLLALALAGVAVIAAAVDDRPGPLGRVLRLAPLRWLGLVSYGAYLVHWPVYVVLDPARTGLEGWALTALRLAVTLALATASYHLLEQPIRLGVRPVRAPALVAPAVAAVVVGALLAGTTGASPVVEAAARPDPIPAAVATAEAAPAEAQRIMVIGNSVGLFLGDGFAALEADPPVVAVNRASIGCTFPLPDDMRLANGEAFPQGLVDCTGTWAADVAAVRPDVVVLALSDPGDGEHLHDGRWTHACDPAYDEWYGAALEQAVGTLSAHGATVAIVGPAYSTIPSAPPVRIERTDCVNAVNAAVAAASPAAVYVDLGARVCPTPSTCRQRVGDVVLRPDGLHYVDDGARVAAGWILADVRRQSG